MLIKRLRTKSLAHNLAAAAAGALLADQLVCQQSIIPILVTHFHSRSRLNTHPVINWSAGGSIDDDGHDDDDDDDEEETEEEEGGGRGKRKTDLPYKPSPFSGRRALQRAAAPIRLLLAELDDPMG